MDTIDLDQNYRNDVTDTLGGYIRVRRYWEFGKDSMDPLFAVAVDEPKLPAIKDVIKRIKGRGSQIWMPQPITEYHRDLFIGQGDGVSRSFIIPALYTGSVPTLRRGDFGGAKNAIVYERANLLDDDEAAAISGAGGVSFFSNSGAGSVVFDPRFDFFGGNSFRADPTGVVDDPGVITSPVPVNEGHPFYGVAWGYISGSGDIVAELQWLDSGGLPILPNAVGTITAATGDFTPINVQGTAPAGAVEAQLIARRDGSTDTNSWFDCLGITPYERPEWWLPSCAPMVATFFFTANDGENLYASLEARILKPYMTMTDKVTRTHDPRGNLIVKFDLMEVWEFD